MDREQSRIGSYTHRCVENGFSSHTIIELPSFEAACDHINASDVGVVIADIDRTIRDQEGAIKALKLGLITQERLSLLQNLNMRADVYAVTNQWTHRGHQLARLQSKGGVRYPINPHAIIDVLGEQRVFGRQEPWPTVIPGNYYKNRQESVNAIASSILSNSFDVVTRGIVGIGDRANDVVFALKVRECIHDTIQDTIPFFGILLPAPPYERWKVGKYIP